MKRTGKANKKRVTIPSMRFAGRYQSPTQTSRCAFYWTCVYTWNISRLPKTSSSSLLGKSSEWLDERLSIKGLVPTGWPTNPCVIYLRGQSRRCRVSSMALNIKQKEMDSIGRCVCKNFQVNLLRNQNGKKI